jgi:hypothetical protein
MRHVPQVLTACGGTLLFAVSDVVKGKDRARTMVLHRVN